MKRKSWRRTQRDGIKPVPDKIIPYRQWCEDNGWDAEDVEAWGVWSRKFRIEDYLP